MLQPSKKFYKTLSSGNPVLLLTKNKQTDRQMEKCNQKYNIVYIVGGGNNLDSVDSFVVRTQNS